MVGIEIEIQDEFESEDKVEAKIKELMGMAKRCFELGLQTGSGGNISVRVDERRVVIKPSEVGFVECSPENLLLVDLDGNILKGTGKPSKDMDFHNVDR